METMTTEMELPEGWQRVKLGEAYSFTKKPRSIRYEDYEQIPFVPMEFVPIGAPSFDRYLQKKPADLTSGNYFEAGDLLLARITPSFENGKQGVIENMTLPFGIGSTELIPIQPKEGIGDRDYLACYLLQSKVRDELASKMEGSTGRQRLNKYALEKHIINLPPLPEQRAIANVLGAVQAALAVRRREQQSEKEHKAALLEQLFTRGTRGEATRETEIGKLPMSWEVTTLGNLLNIKGGKRLAKGAPFAEIQTPHPYIRVTDFTNGTIRVENLKYITAEVQAPIARYIIRQADVYISIAGSIGLVGVIPEELDGANLTENAARLVIKDPAQLVRDYLAKYLATEYGQQQIQGLTVKTTQPKLALARIAWIKIPLPPLPEQQRIAAVLGALDDKLGALATEVARLEELFRALLDELLSGRLRVPIAGE